MLCFYKNTMLINITEKHKLYISIKKLVFKFEHSKYIKNQELK